LIGTVHFRNSPDFRKKRGRGKRRRFVEIEQPVRAISVGEWDRCRLPETWLNYFRLEKRCDYRVWLDVLVFASPHVFELKVEPNWITEISVCDPSVSQRIAEIENWLWHRKRKHRLDRLCGRPGRWRRCPSDRERLLERLAEREVRDAMSGLSEADPVVLLWAIGSASRALFFRIRSAPSEVFFFYASQATADRHPALTRTR
jgi:hypothetical protein